MRIFSNLYGYAAIRVTQSNPFFTYLLAQYVTLTGDRSPILTGDRSPSLDGKSVAFCNAGRPGRAKNSARKWYSFLPELNRAGFEPLILPHAQRGAKPARIADRDKQTHGRAEFFALPIVARFTPIRLIAVLPNPASRIRGGPDP